MEQLRESLANDRRRQEGGNVATGFATDSVAEDEDADRSGRLAVVILEDSGRDAILVDPAPASLSCTDVD
jgi:hypothetical protein